MKRQSIARKSKEVTVYTNSTAGSYIEGIYVPEVKDSFTRMMVSLPVTAEEIKYFERETLTDHGFVTVEDKKFYDYTMDLEIIRGDIIVKNSKEYVILRIMDRTDDGYKIYYGKLKA